MNVTTKILRSREEWLDIRKGYIGGSEASCIVGLNSWKSNVELWEEKTGRRVPEDISDNPIVKYGTDCEPFLREIFKLDYPQYKYTYTDNNINFNDKYPFAHASLDGMYETEDGKLGILEIKTSNMISSESWKKWDNKIPDNYFVQILHYMAVMDADEATLKAQLKSVRGGMISHITRHYHFDRADYEGDIEYLMNKEKEFWECVKADKKPSLVLPPI